MISRVKSFYLIDSSRLEILQKQASLLWTKFQQFGNPSLLHKETCVIYLSMQIVQQTSSPCLQTAQQTNSPFLILMYPWLASTASLHFCNKGGFVKRNWWQMVTKDYFSNFLGYFMSLWWYFVMTGEDHFTLFTLVKTWQSQHCLEVSLLFRTWVILIFIVL